MNRKPSADEAQTLDLIRKSEAMAIDYEKMAASPDAGRFAAAGWPLVDLAEIARATADLARAVLEREGWGPAEIGEALSKRPEPKRR